MAKEMEYSNDMEEKLLSSDGRLPEVINIQSMIQFIRGRQVILDSDLSTLYGVETRRLNER